MEGGAHRRWYRPLRTCPTPLSNAATSPPAAIRRAAPLPHLHRLAFRSPFARLLTYVHAQPYTFHVVARAYTHACTRTYVQGITSTRSSVSTLAYAVGISRLKVALLRPKFHRSTEIFDPRSASSRLYSRDSPGNTVSLGILNLSIDS